MNRKMWVRKAGMRWEVGCQECGHLVFEDWSWRWAMRVARVHADYHAGRPA